MRCLVLFLVTLQATCVVADERVSTAVDRGAAFLHGELQQRLVGPHSYGQLALETYALVISGVPLEDPTLREAFGELRKRMKGSAHTYSLACYAFALDAAIAQLEEDAFIANPQRALKNPDAVARVGGSFLSELSKVVEALIKNQNEAGAWRYFRTPDFDNSNTQFAVLGLGVGAKRGFRISAEVWKGVLRHFVEGQQKDGPRTEDRITLQPAEDRSGDDLSIGGASSSSSKRAPGTEVYKPVDPVVGQENIEVKRRGWDYENKGGATWNMSCAGLSSLLIARKALSGEVDAESWKSLNAAIRDGYGWLSGEWKPTESFYGMYSLEKVADIGDVKLFAAHDWYGELSQHLLGRQEADGRWKGTGKHGEDDRVATAFALLILRRASSLLTRNPANRVVTTGRRSADGKEDRDWVYVPSVDVSLHYPTVVELLEKRPSTRLAALLEEIIGVYPIEHRGETVPRLARLEESTRRSSVKRLVTRCLESITGVELPDRAAYEDWHGRWERIGAAVAGNKKHEPAVLKIFREDLGSPALRSRAAWAMVRLKLRDGIPLLLEDLESGDADRRTTAYETLLAFYASRPPAFDPKASAPDLLKQANAVREWVAREEARLGK